MLFSGPLWWCIEVSGIASFKCLHHSPAVIPLAVLALAVAVKAHLVRMVVELEGVVPGAAMAVGMVLVGAVIALPLVPEEASAGRAPAVVLVPVQMLVNHVGQIPTVAQMLVGLTVEGLVGVPMVGLPVLADRVALAHGVPVLGALGQHGRAIHVVRVVVAIEDSREMIATVMTVGRTDATMSVARFEVEIVEMMTDEGTTGVEMTGAVTTDVLEHGTFEGMTQNVEAADIEVAMTTAAVGLAVLRAPSGKRKHGKTIVRLARNERRVSRETKLSGVRRRCGHTAVVRRDWVSSRQSVKNISISGSMRGPFAKKLSRQCSVLGQRERIISSLMATFVTELMLRCRLLSVLPNCASAC